MDVNIFKWQSKEKTSIPLFETTDAGEDTPGRADDLDLQIGIWLSRGCTAMRRFSRVSIRFPSKNSTKSPMCR